MDHKWIHLTKILHIDYNLDSLIIHEFHNNYIEHTFAGCSNSTPSL